MQGTIDTTDLNKEQMRFVVNITATLLDKLIQDDMDLDDNASPLPANSQQNDTISKAMKLLQYT